MKLKAGRKRIEMVRFQVDCEIPVMGHLGLAPQRVNAIARSRCRAAGGMMSCACSRTSFACRKQVVSRWSWKARRGQPSH
ncbi:ketopantoate hydroxymethyltransferase [Bradyrhizobium canariense]|nr:ketopantoate hydroxymethyltransferase [Bradyrhizobium canariense]